MSATPPQSSSARGNSGRHRGTPVPLTVPWRKVCIRSAAGAALVVGAGLVTFGPGSIPDGAAAPAAAQVDAAQLDSSLAMRLADRSSRSGRSELRATEGLPVVE